MKKVVAGGVRGKVFEEGCCKALEKFGFKTVVQGGAGDQGLDLVGTIALKSPVEDVVFPVGVQCKSYLRRKLAVAAVRELEGSLLNYKDVKGKDEVIGVLCGHSGFTKQTFEHVRRSIFPLALVNFDGPNCNTSDMIYFNPKLQQLDPDLVPIRTIGSKNVSIKRVERQ